MNDNKRDLSEFCGCMLVFIVIVVLFVGLPLTLSNLALEEYKKNTAKNAKETHVCSGTVIKVETGEDPDYTRWKTNKSGGVRIYLGEFKQTTLTFKDGRVKEFAGVPDCEIPLDKPIDIVYDGNGRIKRIDVKLTD